MCESPTCTSIQMRSDRRPFYSHHTQRRQSSTCTLSLQAPFPLMIFTGLREVACVLPRFVAFLSRSRTTLLGRTPLTTTPRRTGTITVNIA